MLEPYATLFRHEVWADATLLEAVAAHPETAADETVNKRLRHTHVVQRAFLAYLEGGKPDLAALREPFDSLAALGASVRAYHERVMQALEGFDDERLRQKLTVEWFPDAEFTFADVLLQMPLHSHSHRGQNLVRLRELGGRPPTLDFIVWTAQGRPAASWSFAAR